MPTFNIKYINEKNNTLKLETVFMRGLKGAKISASSCAPFCTNRIELRNILGTLLAYKENGIWLNDASV
ncbi:hypothetical protein AB9R81_23535 [Vibrio cyclitrophicus]|jgi:hypothetical protein|uniref:Uncharacterized protein n=1 Tax=Vibrio splendidus TaxID=29497 RepID=A0A0H3ZMI8_VIBSP|nr:MULTISPECIES: hypothetical protein [Vibrio]AKN37483.1 hypothetical protein [Vibrio splendidus]NOH43336.1 hypothetical protein [Vibrio cyclitrophicus]NOI36581.1 hypothetical protein [Vibrio cyclitrophicus]PMH05165.1 hypothetical protein BCU75_21645 [Vibrio splendidus]PMJ38056.1 hypothetical protein BCU24_21590 [Vibrio cyclitrophicus]